MQYVDLVSIYQKIESTSKRLEKTKIISEFFRTVDIKDLSHIVLLLQGRIYPPWDDTKIGVASKLVVKAISKSSGNSVKEIEALWKKTGDLGITAENSVAKKAQSTLFSESLSVEKVFANLRKLSTLQGMGSVDTKMQYIAQLLTSAQPLEARYIIRTLLEDLRVGIGEGTLRDAIVWAYFEKEINLSFKEEEVEIPDREIYKKYVDAVQQAYDITNDFATVAQISAQKGYDGLITQDLQVGRPLKVMLALKVNDAKQGIERVGTPLEAEYKLDGFRLQIHKQKDTITLFTRRLEEVTAQFPDVVLALKNVQAESFILDAEAVGFDPKTKKYLPFQSISQRIKRKYRIEEIAEKFPVELNIFDILYYDNESIIHEPLSKRREILEKIVQSKEKEIVVVKKLITSSAEDIQKFFTESINAGNEGLMLKNLESPYKPGARVGYMVKLKETMENLDLVIISAEWGEGKRSSWLSSYTLACRDEDGNLLELGKVSTGLKEKDEEGLSFNQMTQLLTPLILSEKGREVKVKPEIIIEVAYEEIQKSPTYDSGFALRFPRVIRLRSDERADVSALEYVEELYYGQRK